MKITNDILIALTEAVERSGFKANFARKAGVDKANLTRWLNGSIKTISDDSWEKLEPFLRPYLESHEDPAVVIHGGSRGGQVNVARGGSSFRANHQYVENAQGSAADFRNRVSRVIKNDKLDSESKIEMIKILLDEP